MTTEVCHHALHIASTTAEPVRVDPASPLAGALVVAARHPDTPAVVVIADTEALGREIQGCAAVSAMSPVVSWCMNNLHADWMAEGPLWVVMSGESAFFVLHVGLAYELEWTPMRWPGCLPGSAGCFYGALPGYANAVLRRLDDLAWATRR